MPQINKNILEKIIICGLQNHANRIYNRSQDTTGGYVPVQTGYLKSTGNVVNTNKGASINYDAKYARDVEFGHEERNIDEISRVYVRPHRRKDGSYVKGHIKEVKGRIIKFTPKDGNSEITRTITKQKASDGQRYLTRAIFTELPNLKNDIADAIKNNSEGRKMKVKNIRVT